MDKTTGELNPANQFKPVAQYSKISSCVQKRKLEDSGVDEDYETPAKKTCSPKHVSPDPGCFLDYCSPPAKEDSGSPFSISVPAFLDEDVSSQLSGPVLKKSHNPPVEHLESAVENSWSIGYPILESSTYEVTLEEETNPSYTSFESTLPLQVKVKSVVVVPTQPTSSTSSREPETTHLPDKPEPTKPQVTCAVSVISQRDLDRQKWIYVNSVTSHMRDNEGSYQGAVTELWDLMTHVAQDTNGRRWQHPSDFTRRNYQRRFGNEKPSMTLNQWQCKNNFAGKRFAKVPNTFERSQCP